VNPSEVEKAQVSGLPQHVIGVAGVVVDDVGRALTVRRRSPQRWELPGGALERDERIADGLVREVREEIGLDVEPLGLSGIYQNIALGPVALVFACRRVDGTERLSDETSDWRWVSRDEVDALMPPAWAVRFADGLDAVEALGGEPGTGRQTFQPPVRVHDGTSLL
jgi:8-oxo-dGTP diphosphatase